MSKFSERLSFLIFHKDISQKLLTQQIGVTVRCYQRYEYGEREPQLTTLINLAKFYNISMDYLTCLTEEPGQFPQDLDLE